MIADDDEDDRSMTLEALEEDGRLSNDIYFVEDGEELMDFLRHSGKYVDGGSSVPRPGLILLDLNMPKKDGREALAEIKSDPNLKQIPIVVMTTSKAEEDVFKTYELGVNSFIRKPVSFDGLVEIIHNITKYWLEIVELPTGAKQK